MIDGLLVLAVIPARGGSKRCPRKNILPFRGKSLIAWALEAARGSAFIDTTVVSTEDAEIKLIAERLGARVLDRPVELASDTAANEDVMRHAFREQPTHHDLVVLLQPTSPLRTAEDIDKCIELAHMTRRTCISCRQDGERNGAVYVMRSGMLERGHNFLTAKKIIWYRMPDSRSLDIDFPKDFEYGIE